MKTQKQKTQSKTKNPKKPQKAGWLNEFLWTCSGVNKPILRQCPADYSKYAGIGGTILFTALMASLSGGYAMNFVFDNPYIAIAFGIFWGLLIFNLDRFIVNTLYSDGKHSISWGEIKSGLPRIIMAIFLGLVISTPLEMKIFSDQIDAQLLQDNAKRSEEAKKAANHGLDDELKKYELQLYELVAEGNALNNRLADAQEDLRKEGEGSALSGIGGHGPIYRDKERYVNECKEAVNKWEATNSSDIERLKADIIRVKDEIIRQNALINKNATQNGFAVRYEAYANVTSWSEHTSLAIVSLMITLLFVIIETAPTFLKMMMEDGPYDNMLKAEKNRIEKMAQIRKKEADTEHYIFTMKNDKRIEAETIATQDILDKIANAQVELLDAAINEWKEAELEKIRQNPTEYVNSYIPEKPKELPISTEDVKPELLKKSV